MRRVLAAVMVTVWAGACNVWSDPDQVARVEVEADTVIAIVDSVTQPDKPPTLEFEVPYAVVNLTDGPVSFGLCGNPDLEVLQDGTWQPVGLLPPLCAAIQLTVRPGERRLFQMNVTLPLDGGDINWPLDTVAGTYRLVMSFAAPAGTAISDEFRIEEQE